jgi:hypothetical protein
MCAQGATTMKLRSLLASALLATTSLLGLGCDDGTSSNTEDVTDVKHTDVERQSIGNCWLYAEASWVESMNLSATGTAFDISQSYWTYWHWYEGITENGDDSIETGGWYWKANEIITERGLVAEKDFISEDSLGEMSSAQSRAESKLNSELKTGRLKTAEARRNGKLVRQVMDEAWGLKPEVKAWMDKAFGTTGRRTFLTTSSKTGTPILRARDFPVRYASFNGETVDIVDAKLDDAIEQWQEVSYPWNESGRRDFQIRVQRAMHAAQPVIVTWLVDFNAMEGKAGDMQGSFNTGTLKNAGGAGRQGGHMTVMEDYQVMTEEFGLLKAGVTLDPTLEEDKAKLDAALLPTSTIEFFRIKNSWGALRDDRASAAGFPGYHDLYMDYLNGPIAWCGEGQSGAACKGSETPLENVVLPPGF